MANIDITDCSTFSIGTGRLPEVFGQDEALTFPGADTYVKGTILARRRVALTYTPSAVTGTGNGTCTSGTVVEGPIVPLVGNYTLRCIAAATHGGTFRLEDPNGAIVSGNLVMTAGAGVASTFEAAGLRFIITDGSTDFAVGDTFTLPIAADGKLVIFASGGAGGAQVPCAVLTYEVSKTGSGDVYVRPLFGGEVHKKRLVIDADGNDTNVTAAVIDQLRNVGIFVVDTKQLSAADNS
jgi:hypothetical protein